MSELISNLNTIESCKLDIKSAIQAKGVSMSGVSFPDYATAIGSITTQFVTESLSVSQNGTYYPGSGVDGFSEVVVDVPQSVTGYTINDVASANWGLSSVFYCSVSWIRAYAFVSNQSIVSVDLPNCEMLGRYIFNQSNNDDGYCFYYCESLTTISLPVCRFVDQFTFGHCSSLQSIYLPSCQSIGYCAFAYCTNLSLVDLPICSTIGNRCFSNAASNVHLSVYLRSTAVCAISNQTFRGVANFSVYVPSSLVSDYQIATNWSVISSQIFPIPE